jgi:hypothetical protein
MARWYARPCGRVRAESYLDDLDAILPEAKAVLAELQAAARPASDLEIGKHLGVLVKCFPNTGTADRETYGSVLVLDVIAAQPSISDVEAACRMLRQTSNFMPTIAEVLTALHVEKQRREGTIRGVAHIVNYDRDRLVKEAEEERKLHQEKEAERLLRLEQDRKRREEDFW